MIIGIDANEANITHRVGINMYAFHLLHALKNLKSNHKFVIYLKKPVLPDLPEESDNWSYRILPFPKLWTQTRLPLDLYLHSPRPDVFLSLTHYAPRFSPIPLIISIMDLGFLNNPEQFRLKDINQLKFWTSYSVKNASKILSISEYTKQDIIKYYHRRPEDIFVTPLGFDNKLFYPHQNQNILNKYGIKTPFILFVSSLKPSKNVEGLIKAFSLLPVGQNLVIAGKKAWMYEQIFNLVKNLNLENRVIFTDYLPTSDVPILMSHASCFVLPSFHEGFALPAIEAMACGTPVVVSRVANLPEVTGDAAVYIDPLIPESIAEGITLAIKNRQDYIKKGLKRVKLFSWRITAQKTLLCLQTTMAKD